MAGQLTVQDLAQALNQFNTNVQQAQQASNALLQQLASKVDSLTNVQQQVQAQAAAGNVFTAKKVKLELPPMFDGTPKHLTSWLFSVNQYATLVGLSDDDKVKLAVSRLEKDALTWWRQYDAQHTNQQTTALANLDWDTFRTEIGSAFEDIDKELKLRKRLKNLQQTHSVAQYTKAFRSIVLELGDHAPDEDTQVFAFIDGLKEDVQTQVLLQRPTLLTEAEQLAERADAALFKGKQRKPTQPPQQRQPWKSPKYNGPVPMELGLMGQGGQGSYQRRYPTQGGRQSSGIVCFRCGKVGHIQKNCRVNLPGIPPPRTQPQFGHAKAMYGSDMPGSVEPQVPLPPPPPPQTKPLN